jgi:DNA-binding XRE family transcriptional regulator
MKLETVISHYGGVKKMASQLGVSRQTIYLWKEKGEIPVARQAQIEIQTKRKFKARS